MSNLESFITSSDFLLLMLIIALVVGLHRFLNPQRIRVANDTYTVERKPVQWNSTVIMLVLGTAFGIGGLGTLLSHKDDIAAWWKEHRSPLERPAEVAKAPEPLPLEECRNRQAIKPIPLLTDPPATWPLTCLKPGESSTPIEKNIEYELALNIIDSFFSVYCQYPDLRVERMTPGRIPAIECQDEKITSVWVKNTSGETRSFTHAFRPRRKS